MYPQTKLVSHEIYGTSTVFSDGFLSIQSDNHRSGRGACSAYDVDRLAHGCAGSNYIIDDYHVTVDCRTHELPAFPVILYFLAVKCERDVTFVFVR